jgi:hypothetical protein
MVLRFSCVRGSTESQSDPSATEILCMIEQIDARKFERATLSDDSEISFVDIGERRAAHWRAATSACHFLQAFTNSQRSSSLCSSGLLGQKPLEASARRRSAGLGCSVQQELHDMRLNNANGHCGL